MRRLAFGILAGVCVSGAALRLAATSGQAGSPPPVPTFTKDVAPILYKN
jgi:hypothetical protein